MLKRNLAESPVTLPIQHELPKVPSFNALPLVPNSIRLDRVQSCPNLIYCIWKSGRHAAMRLTCKSWSCVNCGKEKLNEISQRVAEATIDMPIIHEIDAKLNELDKITALIRKKKVSAINIKLSNRAYLLLSEELKGRSWGSQAIARAAAIAKLHKIDTTTIRRRDYTLDWRPEPLYDPKRDTVIFSTAFSNTEDLEETLALFNIDIKADYVPGDPMHVMERIVKGRTDYTIQFEGNSYTT